MSTGGYTLFRNVESEDLKVFQEAVKELAGVDFKPLIVATQVVAETNYCFICNAIRMVPKPVPYLAKVTIHKPLPGTGKTNACILTIEEV